MWRNFRSWRTRSGRGLDSVTTPIDLVPMFRWLGVLLLLFAFQSTVCRDNNSMRSFMDGNWWQCRKLKEKNTQSGYVIKNSMVQTQTSKLGRFRSMRNMKQNLGFVSGSFRVRDRSMNIGSLKIFACHSENLDFCWHFFHRLNGISSYWYFKNWLTVLNAVFVNRLGTLPRGEA